MVERRMTFGKREQVAFEFIEPPHARDTTGEELSYLGLLVWVRNCLVWGRIRPNGVERPVRWTWIELVEHWAEWWPFWEYGSGYPWGLLPDRPSLLRSEAERRWRESEDADIAGEEEELFAFEQRHDLAQAAQGCILPSLWFVPERGLMTVEAGGHTAELLELPRADALRLLTDVGEFLVGRFGQAGDHRAAVAREAWLCRSKRSQESLLEIATSVDREYLSQVAAEGSMGMAFGQEYDRFRPTSEVELVGMTRGRLAPSRMTSVLRVIRNTTATTTPALDRLAQDAGVELARLKVRYPFEEGHRMANWLRRQLGISDPQVRIDPEELLRKWGVHLQSLEFGEFTFDAMAYWGSGHGPGVLVNQNAKHRDNEGAVRATLGHEICHLLLDRFTALPLGEVVKGNLPDRVERRANAFSAELLLPRDAVRIAWEKCYSVPTAVDDLTIHHGVSEELTAWQIYGTVPDLGEDDKDELRARVSAPERIR